MHWQTNSGAVEMLKCAVRSKFFWVAIASSALYWGLGLCTPRQQFLEGIRTLEATSSLVGLVAIALAALNAMIRKDPDKGDVLIIFAFLVELAAVVGGIWFLLFRLSGNAEAQLAPEGRAEWMLDTLWFGFVTGWLPALASIILVSVPGVLRDDPETGEKVPPLLLIAAGLVAGAGLLGMLIVLLVRPDARALVESIRPWIR